jgi:hyperosmotically inducible periplasmic protein
MRVIRMWFLQTVPMLVSVVLSSLFLVQWAPAQASGALPAKKHDQIMKEVRHELIMLPFVDVFDNLAFKVDGYDVTLMGSVTRPSIKQDAERAVKGIEGVETVKNEIDVLPPSPIDDRLRLQLFQAIYGFPALRKYDLPVIKPIRIIVRNGRVTLEGVVDTEADKNMVGIRANTVPGIFSVTNNLLVASSRVRLEVDSELRDFVFRKLFWGLEVFESYDSDPGFSEQSTISSAALRFRTTFQTSATF